MAIEKDLIVAHLAVDEKFITPEQLAYCLRQLVMLEKGGEVALVCEMMLQQEFVTVPQLMRLRQLREERDRARLIDGYEVTGVLGQGAVGMVYAAHQLSMDRPVALKVLSQTLTEDELWVTRFVREARATAKLNHVNIVQGIDVGQSHGLHYFAMEYVPGKSLGELVGERGRLPEEEAARILVQAARALGHAWEFGIVHRDIKPDNLLVTDTGVLKLTDMGLAKRSDASSGGMTTTGAIVGTPNYISPEQARGLSDVDTRSDIYSLGVSAFYVLAGQLPFSDPNPAVVMARHINDPVPSVREVVPEISAELEGILHRMTEKKLEWRYQTPAELVADLERYLADNPTIAPPDAFLDPEPPPRAELPGRVGQSTTLMQEPVPLPPAPVPDSPPMLEAADEQPQAPVEYRFCHVPSEEETMFTLVAVKNGLLKLEHVESVLELQETRAEVGATQRLDDLFVEKGYMGKRHRRRIQQVLKEHHQRSQDDRFGEIGIRLGLFGRTQLNECLEIRTRMAGRNEAAMLGDVMVARHYLSDADRHRVLQEQAALELAQESRRLGQIALGCKLIGREELDRALMMQEELSRADPHRAPRLGEVLVRMGALTETELMVVLRAQRRSEMTDQSPRDLVAQMRTDYVDPKDSSVLGIGSLFEGARLKGFDTECPYCEYPVEESMKRCPRCRKLLD